MCGHACFKKVHLQLNLSSLERCFKNHFSAYVKKATKCNSVVVRHLFHFLCLIYTAAVEWEGWSFILATKHETKTNAVCVTKQTFSFLLLECVLENFSVVGFQMMLDRFLIFVVKHGRANIEVGKIWLVFVLESILR